jgi:hypothetical protein
MSANVPTTGLGPVPENLPQSSWPSWLTQIARARNFDAKTIANSGIANFKGFVTTPPLTLYVRSNGSDGNNGLSSSTPFLTINHAITAGQLYFANGGTVVIDIGSGTWGEDIAISGPLWGAANNTANTGRFILSGAGSTNTTLASTSSAAAAIIASDHAFVQLTKLKITSTNGSACFPQRCATIYIDSDVNIGACGLGQLHAESSGIVNIGAGYTISGGAPAALQAVLGGRIIFNESSIDVFLSGTPAFSIGFADFESGSLLYANSSFVSFSGSGATGPRFYIQGPSIIETIGGLATFFPGSSPGILKDGAATYSPATGPTIGTVTGLGTGGSAALVSGSTDQIGYVQLTTGSSGVGTSGNVPLTFGSQLGKNTANCVACVNNGTGSWQPAAAVQIASATPTGVTLVWNNDSLALATGSTFYIAYQCKGF